MESPKKKGVDTKVREMQIKKHCTKKREEKTRATRRTQKCVFLMGRYIQISYIYISISLRVIVVFLMGGMIVSKYVVYIYRYLF